MSNPPYRPSFLRQWRKSHKLSLRKVEERLRDKDGVALISHASLSRMERGYQPWSQDILEALAHIYETDVPSLLARDPKRITAFWKVWDEIPEELHPQALAILEALKGVA